ncbi:MAG TPA: BTAD domain-containing putative transcriptional regulator [Acidimicrobiia bacterium]|nr:BTAD domain-containing putative transcriptional regulator [Acidimicrobiia bacterium]
MRYQVLGPLTATLDDRTVNLGGPKQRLVLGLLLLEAGHTVTADRLIDRLWDDSPPEGARHTLQAYISELRKVLDDPIEWTGHAYRLTAGVDQLDSAEFESLLNDGRDRLDSATDEAASLLREALALWKGRPFEDLEYASSVQTEISRLEELRLEALELRLEADLRLGRQSEILAELDSLTAEYPLREKFRAQQMLALYRSGRQAEALRAFARLRQTLADELGIDPSLELQGLEEQLLSQDRSLDLSPTAEPELVFLFTDLEGSTALWEIHADDTDAAVSDHHEAVEGAITAEGGSVFKTTGDGALAVMPSVTAAVDAACQIQRQGTRSHAGAIEELSTRVAIDVGPARMRDGDYFGSTLNRCARLLGMAHGGQILLSPTAAQAVPVVADTRVLDLGERRLKGIGSPQRIFQLVAPDLEMSFPPLRTDGSSRVLSTIGFEATTIRGYELRDRIGEGDFGVVYRAYQTSVGREVAIKAIRSEYSNRPTFVRRFEAEAQFVAELEHPHIVSLYDYWRDPDGAYLVMPYMRGGSLAQALQRGPWNAGPALRLLDQVGAALSYAHRKGVIHRDLKPANVLLDEDGNAYLSDFGLSAHLTDKTGAPLTSCLTYVPPEELRGEALTPESDIFCLAVLTFELFSGIRPMGRGRLLSITGLRPDLPIELATALESATDDRPGQRPDRVEDFLRAVRQAIGADVIGVAIEPSGPSSSTPIRNPYKGLRAFQETDAGDFHGREALMDELLEAVLHHRLVALVGPSGGGKSSVVRAGLLPALRAGALPESRGWLITDMFPGSYPFEELEAALLRVAVHDPGALLDELRSDDRGLLRIVKRVLPSVDTELVLLIDQFEELFSMVDDEDTRNLFLGALSTLVGDERGRVRIIITLRADFFDRPLQYPLFGQLVKDGLVPVLPPNDEGLSLAISRPARGVGLDLEPGLVGEIVNEVRGQPGGLPLLQYALTELFQRRQGSVLTLANYHQTGGVLGALGRRAEETFSGLTPAGQQAAHQLFLRLVTVDEEADDTRRRVRQSELRGLDVDQAALDTVIKQYASYRLLTFDRDPLTRSPTVEVAHEALLRGWDRLGTWIDGQRDELVLRRRLAAAHHEWEQMGEDVAFLLAGGRLEQFEIWARDTGLSLTGAEERYLATSRTEDDRLLGLRTARRRRIMAGFAGAAVVALLLAVVAFLQRGQAQESAALAEARELILEAEKNVVIDPELSMLLALEAIEAYVASDQEAPPSAQAALRRGMAQDRVLARVPGGRFVAVSPDGNLFATRGQGDTLVIRSVDTMGFVTTLALPDEERYSASFHPSGDWLAVPYANTIRVLDLKTPGGFLDIGSQKAEGAFTRGMRFSADGNLIVAVVETAASATVEVWSFPNGALHYSSGPDRAVGASFSSDGRLAYIEFPDGGSPLLRIFDVVTWRELQSIPLDDLEVPDPSFTAFAPDGKRLAIAGYEVVAIIDLTTEETLWHTDPSLGRAFEPIWLPGGERLFVGGEDLVKILDAATGQVIDSLPGHQGGTWSYASVPGTDWVLSAGRADGQTVIFDLGPPFLAELGTFPSAFSGVVGMEVVGDGGRLAVRDTNSNGVIDARTGELIDLRPGNPMSRQYVPSFSADGLYTAGSASQGGSRLWSNLDGRELLSVPDEEIRGVSEDGSMAVLVDPITDRTRLVTVDGTDIAELEVVGGNWWKAVFSPDGRYVATNRTGSVQIWDSSTGTQVGSIEGSDLAANSLLWTPDGSQLVLGGMDGIMRFFDVDGLLSGVPPHETIVRQIAAHDTFMFLADLKDESMVLTTALGEPAKVWDVTSGLLLGEFGAPVDGDFVATAFHPTEPKLYAAVGVDQIGIFTLEINELIAIAKSRLSRDLTEEECQLYLRRSCAEDA